MQKQTKAGYVYILTNPSFRIDRIKIGKSSKPINVRSKQLFNTSIPTPFEIFATMKTTKFNQVETMVHSFIDILTDKRVNQKREFFDILPEKALEIFKIIYPVIDDAFIEIYNQGKVVNSIGQNSIGSTALSSQLQDSIQVTLSSNIPIVDYYLDDKKSVATYYMNIQGPFIKGVLKENNMLENIFEITSLNKLEELKKLVKIKEKAEEKHGTYSNSIAELIKYLKAGFSYKEFKHDAEYVKNKYKK